MVENRIDQKLDQPDQNLRQFPSIYLNFRR